jgi:hypothetical protein
LQPLAAMTHVQASARLYVQVQVEPVRSASHRLLALSEHAAVHDVIPFGAAEPLPEHDWVPTGRGMPWLFANGDHEGERSSICGGSQP